jgi:hypothetical protein
MTNKYMTTKQVANELEVSAATVVRWVRDGILPDLVSDGLSASVQLCLADFHLWAAVRTTPGHRLRLRLIEVQHKPLLRSWRGQRFF